MEKSNGFDYFNLICNLISIAFITAPIIILMGAVGSVACLIAVMMDRIGGPSIYDCISVMKIGLYILTFNCAFLSLYLIVSDEKFRDFFKYYGIICKKILKKFNEIFGE